MHKLLIVVLSLGVMSGCAVGVKHDYSSPRPQLTISKAATLAVGAQDRRPYVLGGNKSPDFVGLSRGGFGNTFDIATQSGAPLADDFSQTIVATLKEKGIQAESVKLAPKAERKEVEAALRKAPGGKGVLVTLKEWKTDTYTHTLLIYDVAVEVLASNGTVLARNNIQGTDNLGGSAVNPPAHSRRAAPEAFRKNLEKLLNDPDVIQAMQ
jgi:hypothetical protein